MDTKAYAFIALAITMLYGVGFTVIDDGIRSKYATIGGVLVALVWIAVGTFGPNSRRRDRIDG